MSGIQWAESGQNARCDVDAQAEAFPHTQRQRKIDAEREREGDCRGSGSAVDVFQQ